MEDRAKPRVMEKSWATFTTTSVVVKITVEVRRQALIKALWAVIPLILASAAAENRRYTTDFKG